MENYLEVTFRIEEYLQEALLAELLELGFSGFNQHPNYMEAYIEENAFAKVSNEDYIAVLEPFGGRDIEVSRKQIAPKNWNEEWEKTIQPIRVGEYYIRATWHDKKIPEGCKELIIDPKMAFGTGYHETTRLMLQSITQFVKEGDRILDVGTGTGILSIAALKKNAAFAFGFDIDEWSYRNALENAALNGIHFGFEVAKGSFETVKNKDYDVVIANVNRSVILSLKEDIIGHVKTDGFVFLSGLLKTEAFIIKEDPAFLQMKLISEISEGDWTGLIYQNSIKD